MNTSRIFRLCAALLAAATLTGCSLLKVAVSTGDPLSKEQMRMRTMTRGFYYDFAAQVARTADSIVELSPRSEVRIAAVKWKIRATRAGVSAAMQAIPDVAMADLWILCRRMNETFAAAPDSLLFGAQSDLARDVASRLERQAARLAQQVLPDNRYELMSGFVDEYVRKTPDGQEDVPVNTTLAWLEYLRGKGVEHTEAVGSIAEVLADVNDRLSGQTQQLSSSIGWSKDMIEMQLRQDSLRSQIGRQLDSLERSFSRMAGVAEHLPEISSSMMSDLSRQVTQIIYTVNGAVDNAFENLDNQRTELQTYISTEREAFVREARTAADEALRTALDALPSMLGKIIFYVVLALVVLLGLPFAGGYWLGNYRQRAKEKRVK